MLSIWPMGRERVYCALHGRLFMARPRIDTHYFHPHSCGKNSVTWLCLTSMKRARKYSPAMCPTHRQDRELFEAGQSFFCSCILTKVCEKCTVLFTVHLMPSPATNVLIISWQKPICQHQHQSHYHSNESTLQIYSIIFRTFQRSKITWTRLVKRF